jgi:hypothetical protein
MFTCIVLKGKTEQFKKFSFEPCRKCRIDKLQTSLSSRYAWILNYRFKQLIIQYIYIYKQRERVKSKPLWKHRKWLFWNTIIFKIFSGEHRSYSLSMQDQKAWLNRHIMQYAALLKFTNLGGRWIWWRRSKNLESDEYYWTAIDSRIGDFHMVYPVCYKIYNLVYPVYHEISSWTLLITDWIDHIKNEANYPL